MPNFSTGRCPALYQGPAPWTPVGLPVIIMSTTTTFLRLLPLLFLSTNEFQTRLWIFSGENEGYQLDFTLENRSWKYGNYHIKEPTRAQNQLISFKIAKKVISRSNMAAVLDFMQT